MRAVQSKNLIEHSCRTSCHGKRVQLWRHLQQRKAKGMFEKRMGKPSRKEMPKVTVGALITLVPRCGKGLSTLHDQNRILSILILSRVQVYLCLSSLCDDLLLLFTNISAGRVRQRCYAMTFLPCQSQWPVNYRIGEKKESLSNRCSRLIERKQTMILTRPIMVVAHVYSGVFFDDLAHDASAIFVRVSDMFADELFSCSQMIEILDNHSDLGKRKAEQRLIDKENKKWLTEMIWWMNIWSAIPVKDLTKPSS